MKIVLCFLFSFNCFAYSNLIKKPIVKYYFETIKTEVENQDDLEIKEWVSKLERKDYQMHYIVYMAVALAESSMNTNAISNKGCLGIMQLEPLTAKDMGFNLPNIKLLNPEINMHYGTKYLRWVYQYFRGQRNRLFKTLDAYNRGIGNVTKYPYKGDYKEQRYVKRVLYAMEFLKKNGFIQKEMF